MTDSTSKFDASFQGLGYVHQFRCALLLGLQRYEEPNHCLCIEKLDDVSIHESHSPQAVASEVRQYKLHKDRDGNLGDKSLDVWKSLRVWSQAIVDGKIDLNRTALCLVTTSIASEANAVKWLRKSERDTEKARKQLEAAGSDSDNTTVKQCVEKLQKLSEDQRKLLFQNISLLDGEIHTSAIQSELHKQLWFVPQHHRTHFVECLEGWWINLLCDYLADPSATPIPIGLIQQKAQDLLAQFRRECLPDHLLDEQVPSEHTPNLDDRVFVKQLLLIGVSEARRRIAQEDHYRAFTQRSRWVREQLLGFNEEERFEKKLKDCWLERFEIMREGISEGAEETLLVSSGSKLYQWITTEAPSRSNLWFRPDFQSEYMVKGSFHLLADTLHVGWHPAFAERLKTDGPDQSGLMAETVQEDAR